MGGGILVIIILLTIFSGSKKIELTWDKNSVSKNVIKPEIKVYVENSGSMDAYMCSGSDLKDAVFDYVSDLQKYSDNCTLYYINSKIIPYGGNLQSYIKDLTPTSFAKAGGDRTNTDLRTIFENILSVHKKNTVTVFVSDCILDLPQNSLDFLGNCEVSVKNTFNEALRRNPELGVMILKMESKFDGYWYCGGNMEYLSNVKRPYYIWILGNKKILADLNAKVPVNDIYGGVKEYCAYVNNNGAVPFDIEKKIYVVNHHNVIKVNILADLRESLQNETTISNKFLYTLSNPTQASVAVVSKVTAPNSQYSHLIQLDINSPATLKSQSVTFTYPLMADWVEKSNDDTGDSVKQNIDKTTGIKHLIKGVAEAYKNSTTFGTITFNIKK